MCSPINLSISSWSRWWFSPATLGVCVLQRRWRPVRGARLALNTASQLLLLLLLLLLFFSESLMIEFSFLFVVSCRNCERTEKPVTLNFKIVTINWRKWEERARRKGGPLRNTAQQQVCKASCRVSCNRFIYQMIGSVWRQILWLTFFPPLASRLLQPTGRCNRMVRCLLQPMQHSRVNHKWRL